MKPGWIVFTILLFSVELIGKAIYVDRQLTSNITNGTYSPKDRNGTGNSGNAYPKIQTAVNQMGAGDTLYIRGGVYNEMRVYIGDLRGGNPAAWYTFTSYPGEWAVIDGEHDPANSQTSSTGGHPVFYGTTAGGEQGYMRFENMEITGGGLDTNSSGYPSENGAAIRMRGGPFEFRRLFIHDNYGSASGNSAGLMLENGTGLTVVEYCRFKANGEVKGDHTTSVCNLMIFSDYRYDAAISSLVSDRGFSTSMHKNRIRYNLFEAEAGNGYYTLTGFKHKGMQRLTGYNHADQNNSADQVPRDSRYQDFGDRIHNNIFLHHGVAIEIDQDYAQVHNNIIVGKTWPDYDGNCIQGRDANTDRRGPFGLCVYNNTIAANSVRGILHHPVPQGWSGTMPYTKCWILNNILHSPGTGWHAGKISVSSDDVRASQGYPLDLINLSHNYFCGTGPDSLAFVHTTYYGPQQMLASPLAQAVYHNGATTLASLFMTQSGNKYAPGNYTTNPNHQVSGAKTLSNGGISMPHPYLAGDSFPGYLGATEPGQDSWVQSVLDLTDLDKGLSTKSRSSIHKKTDIPGTSIIVCLGGERPLWGRRLGNTGFSGAALYDSRGRVVERPFDMSRPGYARTKAFGILMADFPDPGKIDSR